MSKFHYTDGWYFERLEEGTVRIYHNNKGAFGATEEDQVLDIDPASWASIVASVSKLGETSETYQRAIAYHQGDLN